MTLEEFIAARIGTRFFEVAPRGRLTRAGKQRGKSKAIAPATYDAIKAAYERGEAPGDRLTRSDLALIGLLSRSDTKRIEAGAVHYFIMPTGRSITARRDRLGKWQRCGLIEPAQQSLLPDVPASYALTPKGERIGKAAPHA
jgi:hypothetical protein